MLSQNTLFLVPIYRQKREKFLAEIEAEYKKYEQRLLKDITSSNAGEEQLQYFKNEEQLKFRYQRWLRRKNYSWDFNQIIGWVEIYTHGIIIKSDLWFIDSKKVSRILKNKNIIYRGKIGDVSDITLQDNSKIRQDILDFIKYLQKGEEGFQFLKDYYIYDKLILDVINFIDIKALVQSRIRK